MNTFLPYESFQASAMCLDDKRLNKQRLETRQILDTLLGYSEGWKHHPCVKMWRGYEKWLAAYGIAICEEILRRGKQDSFRPDFVRRWTNLPDSPKPPWLGDPRVHSSHRANLVRKNAKRYKEFLGFTEQPATTYYWP